MDQTQPGSGAQAPTPRTSREDRGQGQKGGLSAAPFDRFYASPNADRSANGRSHHTRMAHRVPISADDSQEEMRRMLLAIIPRERGKSMK